MSMRIGLVGTACISLSLSCLLACDEPASSASQSAPAPYSGAIVFIADGTWDPLDPNHVPTTFEQAQRELWGFDDAAIAQYVTDSNAFFLERFGIDVDDPALAERISVGELVVDERANYRVVSMSGRVVPREGWKVTDVTRSVAITDPAGLELGGEFEGIVAPVGAMITVGRYTFASDEGETFHIDFRSASFIAFNGVGTAVAHCELTSEAFGPGEAFVAVRQQQSPSGEVTMDLRNVLLFE